MLEEHTKKKNTNENQYIPISTINSAFPNHPRWATERADTTVYMLI